MFGWHHELNRHKFEQAPGVCDGQRGLAWCSPRGHKDLDMNEWLNWTELECLTLGLSCLGLPGFLGLFLFHFMEVFNYYLLKYFLKSFLFAFFLGHLWFKCFSLWYYARSLWGCPHFFFLFFLFPLFFIYFHIYLPAHLPFLLPQLLCCWSLQNIFNLSYYIVHYGLTILYFF